MVNTFDNPFDTIHRIIDHDFINRPAIANIIKSGIDVGFVGNTRSHPPRFGSGARGENDRIFCYFVSRLNSTPVDRPQMTIHPTAIIESGAQLGNHVKIGPYTYIESGVTVGDNCAIASHVAILAGTRLGNNCKVHAGAVLGDVPQDLAFKDEPSSVKIGDRCVIREGVTVHRGTKAGTETLVGDDCLLMAYSHLAHNVKVGDRVIVANGALVAGYAEIGDRAFISGNCLIHQFTRVGRLAMMSGGCAIQKDVPPFCITRSLSTNTVMGLNAIGLRRAGFSQQQRRELQNALKILYRSQLNISQALEKLESELTSDLVRELCEFIRTSRRGICKFI